MSNGLPKTRPPKYDRTLTYESAQARAGGEQELAEVDQRIDFLTEKETRTVTEMKELLVLRARSRRLELALDYQGANPKKLPKAIIKEIANGAALKDGVEDEYRKKIKNRATAIRAKCVSCMSGQPGLVRECANVGCPLYMFRMGDNPLFGFEIPKFEIASQDEDDADFEDGGDDE